MATTKQFKGFNSKCPECGKYFKCKGINNSLTGVRRPCNGGCCLCMSCELTIGMSFLTDWVRKGFLDDCYSLQCSKEQAEFLIKMHNL